MAVGIARAKKRIEVNTPMLSKNPERPRPGGSAELASGGLIRIDPSRSSFGWVTCPDCKVEQYSSIPTGQRWVSFTGRCRSCAGQDKRKYSGVKQRVVETPYDGRKSIEIDWDDRDPKHKSKAASGAFKCWYCGKKHYALSITIENPTWDGLTIECRRRRRCRDEKTLPSGAKVRRDPDKPDYFGWVTCPVGGPGCKGTRYVRITASAKGVCRPCSKRQHTKDVTVYDWPTTPDGPPGPPIAHILYSREDSRQRQVPVKYLLCQHTQILKGVGARLALHLDGRIRFPKHCRSCKRNPDAFLAAVEAARSAVKRPSGNGQGNGNGEKQGRGGAHHVIWDSDKRAHFLTHYEECLKKIQNKDPDLPEEVRKAAGMRGNKPSDVARNYAARLCKVPSNDYLQRVLAQARRERGESV